MHDYKKYTLPKLINKIIRRGSTLQKRGVKVCSELGLFSRPSGVCNIDLVGPIVFDLCSWGYKELELIYHIDSDFRLDIIESVSDKYHNLPNYKHFIYDNDDTIINFYYEDWSIYVYLTDTDYEFRRTSFFRDYLIDSFSPEDRSLLVSLTRTGMSFGQAIKYVIKFKRGENDTLVRLADLQIEDFRHDTMIPYSKLILVSGMILESFWNRDKKNWMLKSEGLPH